MTTSAQEQRDRIEAVRERMRRRAAAEDEREARRLASIVAAEAEGRAWRSDLEAARDVPGEEGEALRAELSARARRVWFWMRLSIAAWMTLSMMAFGIGWALLIGLALFVGGVSSWREKGVDVLRDVAKPHPAESVRGAMRFGGGVLAGLWLAGRR